MEKHESALLYRRSNNGFSSRKKENVAAARIDAEIRKALNGFEGWPERRAAF
jgi:hypothetical protein